MLYGLVYLLAIFCVNVNDSTAPTNACSVSERWQVSQNVIANEMRQEKKIIIFLDYNTKKNKSNHKIEGCNCFF